MGDGRPYYDGVSKELVDLLNDIIDNKYSALPLLVDDKKYYDKWIATPNINSKRVISFGNNSQKVKQEAINKGYKNPNIFIYHRPEIVFADYSYK